MAERVTKINNKLMGTLIDLIQQFLGFLARCFNVYCVVLLVYNFSWNDFITSVLHLVRTNTRSVLAFTRITQIKWEIVDKTQWENVAS